MMNGTRFIRWYSLKDDHMVGEEPLRNIDADRLMACFDVGDDREMVECYPLTAAARKLLQPHLHHQVRPDRYAYFVEYDAARAASAVTAA